MERLTKASTAVLFIALCLIKTPSQEFNHPKLSTHDLKCVITKYQTSNPSSLLQHWMSSMPAPIVHNTSFREKILTNLPPELLKLKVDDPELTETVTQVLSPVLALYNRARVYEIIIVRHSTPLVMSDSGVALVITTGALAQTDSDDALLGIAAHEVAHEYFVMRSYEARTRYQTLRSSGNSPEITKCALAELAKIELECDAFAAITLAAIGRNPSEYANELLKTSQLFNRSSDHIHPPAEQRKEVITGVVPENSLTITPQRTKYFKLMKNELSALTKS